MADGFTEEEIAAKLGNPAVLASQFESVNDESKSEGKKLATVFRLYIIDIIAGVLLILLVAWEIIMTAFSLCNIVIAICEFWHAWGWFGYIIVN